MTDDTKILIVDDDDLVRRSLIRVLDSQGFKPDNIDEAASVAEAKTKIDPDNKPDLIFLDNTMPGGKGGEWLKHEREQQEKGNSSVLEGIPVIMHTDEPTVKNIVDDLNSRNVGKNAFLPKPSGIDAMKDAIQKRWSGHTWPKPRQRPRRWWPNTLTPTLSLT